MNHTTRTDAPWYRQGWPWFLILLPATVVVACIATLLIALANEEYLVRDEYYKDGLAINRELARDESARSLGLSADLAVANDTLAVELRLAGAIDPPARLRLEILHPTDAMRDQTLVLMHDGGGVYAGRATQPVAGNYRLLLEPESGDWRLRARLAVDAGTHASAALRAR